MKFLLKFILHVFSYFFGFFFKLFQFKSYSTLFSWLKILFTLKGFLTLLANLLARFGVKIYNLSSLLRKIIKSDVTVLLTLSSVIKYFIHNYNLSRIYVYITVGLELLALSALVTSTLQFHFFTIESFIIFFNELYGNLQDYFKYLLESLVKFFQDPVKYLKNIFTWLQEWFSSDSISKTDRTPEMPADLFLVENQASTDLNQSTELNKNNTKKSVTSLDSAVDHQPYSIKE